MRRARHNKLALFDLDGTLIDNAYRLTDARIDHSVENVQHRGWTVGLSSDTPYEVLEGWRRQLGMNGPIIAERGAVVEVGDKLIFDARVAAKVALARDVIARYLHGQQNTTVWQGNSTNAIRQGETIGEPGQRSVLINNLSLCSLRFYVRRVSNTGAMVIDDSLTQATIEELAPFYPDLDDPSIDNNPTFGIMIMSEKGVDKRSGLATLLEDQPYQHRIMVGNSMGDYIGDDLVQQYAVANADDDYKQRSILVAENPLTSGCIEILDKLK